MGCTTTIVTLVMISDLAREWHGWVGCVLTLVMGIRVLIPQVPQGDQSRCMNNEIMFEKKCRIDLVITDISVGYS